MRMEEYERGLPHGEGGFAFDELSNVAHGTAFATHPDFSGEPAGNPTFDTNVGIGCNSPVLPYSILFERRDDHSGTRPLHEVLEGYGNRYACIGIADSRPREHKRPEDNARDRSGSDAKTSQGHGLLLPPGVAWVRPPNPPDSSSLAL
jgi:hypothetical protein